MVIDWAVMTWSSCARAYMSLLHWPRFIGHFCFVQLSRGNDICLDRGIIYYPFSASCHEQWAEWAFGERATSFIHVESIPLVLLVTGGCISGGEMASIRTILYQTLFSPFSEILIWN